MHHYIGSNSMNTNITTVIFDFDGLLVDTESMSFAIYQEMLLKENYTLSLEEYCRTFMGNTEVENVRKMIDLYDLPWTLEEGMKLESYIENRKILEGVRVKKGANELLEYLHQIGFTVAMATSSTEERTLNILNAHGLSDMFDCYVFGDEVERSKPFPDIFLKVSEKLNESPENCLVIEDSESGIQAAFLAGMKVICVPDLKIPDRKYLEKTILVISSLDKVKSYLEQI